MKLLIKSLAAYFKGKKKRLEVGLQIGINNTEYIPVLTWSGNNNA